MTDVSRCAVYTRKSSDEGLEQSFNSLHAQREACEAYILSQKHEGWQLWPKAYDDGGFSGGNMDRPGLKHLLNDVKAGLVDTIVVYKVDRLSRSLSDFAKMVDLFEEHRVSFVSVTQAFNTTSSMGRLTLNMLLSFAQFEREVTGERIRDKIAASKAKGMWMGGNVPLGYDVADRKLIINEPEAAQVRQLFELYLKHKAADVVVHKASALGIRSKLRETSSGTCSGGSELSRGSLYRVLANRIYVGEIEHKGKVHPGQHVGIIEPGLFQSVQQILARNRRKKRGSVGMSATSPLAGLVFDHKGQRLGPSHTSKSGKRYRYYASDNLRVRADNLEVLVRDALKSTLRDAGEVAKLLPTMSLISSDLILNAAQFADTLEMASGAEIATALAKLISRISLNETGVEVMLRLAPDVVGIMHLDMNLVSGRERLTLVVPSKSANPDNSLIAMIAKARSWFERLTSADQPSIASLAAEDGTSADYIRQVIGAAFLAPDLVTRIVEGRQPPVLTSTRLRSLLPLPTNWEDQRALINGLN